MKRHYYSPQLDRELITVLYHEAKARRLPMTRLVNQLLRAALRYEGVPDEGTHTGNQTSPLTLR
ncbi:MAG: hypothetical protein M3Y69_09875 [Verrucomicrobiota bacterium]|nr:hypothetical protein [Verrucomicrobiota bacterium]